MTSYWLYAFNQRPKRGKNICSQASCGPQACEQIFLPLLGFWLKAYSQYLTWNTFMLITIEETQFVPTHANMMQYSNAQCLQIILNIALHIMAQRHAFRHGSDTN